MCEPSGDIVGCKIMRKSQFHTRSRYFLTCGEEMMWITDVQMWKQTWKWACSHVNLAIYMWKDILICENKMKSHFFNRNLAFFHISTFMSREITWENLFVHMWILLLFTLSHVIILFPHVWNVYTWQYVYIMYIFIYNLIYCSWVQVGCVLIWLNTQNPK